MLKTEKVSGIDNFDPGYIDKDNEVIVGLQTDKPLKRIVNPYGGMRMVEQSLNEYGYKLNKDIENHFKEYRKTHNDGVFERLYLKNEGCKICWINDWFAGCIWKRKNYWRL